MGYLDEFLNGLFRGYKEIINTEFIEYGALVNVFIFAVLIAIYSVFTWKFYRFLSKKDLIGLNLNQYNRTTHPLANKFFATILYMVEYIIILPFIIFFWFATLAFIILVLSEELAVKQIIIVSAAMVAAIRILAYYEEDLSKDLAKMFPFTVLAIFILSPGFFSIDRVVNHLQTLPGFIKNIVLFLILIIVVEVIFRVIDVLLNFFRSEGEIEEESVS